MTSTTKRAKCLSGSHSSTDGGKRYPVSRSIVRKLLKGVPPSHEQRRINASILPNSAPRAKSDRLLETDAVEGDAESNNVVAQVRGERPSRRGSQPRCTGMPGAPLQHAAWRQAHFDLHVAAVRRS